MKIGLDSSRFNSIADLICSHSDTIGLSIVQFLAENKMLKSDEITGDSYTTLENLQYVADIFCYEEIDVINF